MKTTKFWLLGAVAIISCSSAQADSGHRELNIPKSVDDEFVAVSCIGQPSSTECVVCSKRKCWSL